MAWSDVEWTGAVDAGGDEAKLDGMQANLAHLRTEMQYRYIGGFAGRSEGWHETVPGGCDATTNVRLMCSLQYSSTFAADGAWHDIDWTLDVSYLTPGQLHLLWFYAQAQMAGGSWVTICELGIVWYYGQADEDRLRIAISCNATADAKAFGLGSASDYMWVQARGFSVGAYRNGTGDAAWTAVEFVSSPPELVSDTDMNAMHTNAMVLRDRSENRTILAANLLGAGFDFVLAPSGLELTHGVKHTVYLDSVEIGSWSGFSSHVNWVSAIAMELALPQTSSWGLQELKILTTFAQNSAPNDWIGMSGVGTDGWPLVSGKFWKSPEDQVAVVCIAYRDWRGTDLMQTTVANAVTLRPLSVQIIASRGARAAAYGGSQTVVVVGE